MNGYNMVYQENEIIFSHKEKRSTDICYKADDPKKLYALSEKGHTQKVT